MEEKLKSLMVVSSFQAELDSKMDDEWKGERQVSPSLADVHYVKLMTLRSKGMN